MTAFWNALGTEGQWMLIGLVFVILFVIAWMVQRNS